MLLDPGRIGWQPINDGVMGGLSHSTWSVDEDGLHFRGMLSTANGGGFASVRGALATPLGLFRHLALTVSGDGRRYQLRLRESGESDAVAWRAYFVTRADRQTVRLSADEFEPVIRGRRVEVKGGLAERRFRHIGFMLTSRQDGPFALSVHRIEIRSLQDS